MSYKEKSYTAQNTSRVEERIKERSDVARKADLAESRFVAYLRTGCYGRKK